MDINDVWNNTRKEFGIPPDMGDLEAAHAMAKEAGPKCREFVKDIRAVILKHTKDEANMSNCCLLAGGVTTLLIGIIFNLSGNLTKTRAILDHCFRTAQGSIEDIIKEEDSNEQS